MTDTATSSTTSTPAASAPSTLQKFEADLAAEEAKIDAAFKKYLPYVYGFVAGAAVATIVHLIF